ncbi:hypothetical protein GF402_07500, partial [Candidatus Fermentibacteria bacterium]|nr:hypothetical protein [Candidatus Fermentibacteria bacterium]
MDDLVPERIGWSIVRETPTGEVTVETRYVVHFHCPLSYEETEKPRLLYFRHDLEDMYPDDGQGLIVCLSNCGDMQGWDNLGIDNIEENCWDTNSNHLFSGDVTNPVLAAYADGPYRLDVTCYSHDDPGNPAVEFDQSIDCELHNFSPVVQEVVISGSSGEVYHAEWIADGLTPQLDITTDIPVESTELLDLTIVFSEPMNTSSALVTAGQESPYDDVTATQTGWSSTNCPDEADYRDTWHGTLGGMAFFEGEMTLSIQAEDQDANGLMDPSATAMTDERYSDTHHNFTLTASEECWTSSLHDVVYGSAVIADLDGDGDLDIAIQSEDGWTHVLDDDGSALNANWPCSGGWPPSAPDVMASPTLADLDEDGDIDLLAVNPYGCRAYDVATGNDLSGWPQYFSFNWTYFLAASPAVGDVDGDGHLEVVVCRVDDGTGGDEPTVFLLEHDGTNTWSKTFSGSSGGGVSIMSTPSIGDISSTNSGMEIAVPTADGYWRNNGAEVDGPRAYTNYVYLLDSSGNTLWTSSGFDCQFRGQAAVADVDDDDVNELIVGSCGSGSDSGKLFVLNGNTGVTEEGFDLDGWMTGSAAVADLDDDGVLDVVAASNSDNVYAWSGDSWNMKSGFPVDVGSNPTDGASIADVDGDLDVEIVVGTADGNIYVIEYDGSISAYLAVAGSYLNGQLAIGEMDSDDKLEIIFTDNSQSNAYCYEMSDGSFPAEAPWRQLGHDSWHSGCFEVDNTIPAPPTDLEGDPSYNQQGELEEVYLSWDYSVNDPNHPDPQDPADVIGYGILRSFPPYDPELVPIGRVST